MRLRRDLNECRFALSEKCVLFPHWNSGSGLGEVRRNYVYRSMISCCWHCNHSYIICLLESRSGKCFRSFSSFSTKVRKKSQRRSRISFYIWGIFSLNFPQEERTTTQTPRFLCIAQVWLENQTKTEPTNFQNYCTRYLVETDSKKKGQSEIDSYSALDIKYGRRRRTGTTAAGPRFGRGIGSEFDPWN